MRTGSNMRKALISALAMLAFLAAAWPGLAPASQTGSRHVQVSKTTSGSKAKLKQKASKKKGLSVKKHRRYKIKRYSYRKRSLAAEMGAPYTGGELYLRSASVLVVDQGTGEPLYAKNPGVETPIASITKLMTAMVTLDAGLPLHEEITIDAQDLDRLKGTGSRLALGSTLTREELLHLALIASENRAASALSRAYPGGREAFIEAMNRKAQQLGMLNTHFVDGTGLSSANRSTATDLVKLVDAAYRYPLVRQISTTGSYDVLLPAKKRMRHLAFNNTNLLTRRSDWEIGVSKTGYINEAGHCLVMQARIAEQKVIIVLLDSWGKLSRIGDATRIRKWLEYGATGRLASSSVKESV